LRFADAGIAAIIYTDIDRDGMLQGINIDSTLSLAESVPVPVIASGGLGSMTDIERLSRPDCAPLAGVIAGRALYDGRIDPAMALAIFANRTVPA
jgi:phosphoribosylformimino-5-aminoimidazole carboxamide ribotide isomerase